MPARTGQAASEPAKLRLAAKLDQKAALALTHELCGRRGADLTLDASETSHIGTLAVQALLAAAISWARDGHRLRLVDFSDGFADQLSLLGLSPQTLVEGAAS